MNTKVKISIISVATLAVLGIGALFARPLFIKAGIIKQADLLARAIESGTYSDISSLTDKSDKDVISGLKANLTGEDFTSEENSYAQAVRDTIVCTVDKSSVELQNSTHAVCSIKISMADWELLKDETYDNIDELEDIVSDLGRVEFVYKVNYIKQDGEWLVSNLDSSSFARIFSYRDIDLEIGLPSLITTSDTIASLIPCVDPDSPIAKSSTYNQELYDQINSYCVPKTEDNARFSEAVRSLMTCTVLDEQTYVQGRTGYATLSIRTPDYERLAGQRFSNIDEAILSLGSLTKKETEITLEFTRDDNGIWSMSDPEVLESVFLFADFNIVMADLDGDYSCYVDITEQVNNIMANETGVGSRIYEGTQGQVLLRVYLNLDGYTYSYGADEDYVSQSLMDYFSLNIDTIAKNYLGTDNQTVLDTLAALAGYQDYANLKTTILTTLSGMTDQIYFGSISATGEYKLSGENIIFAGQDPQSDQDDITGTLDPYGRITVTLPIADPEVAEMFGRDTIDLIFEKDA